jgi:hypothetical protein
LLQDVGQGIERLKVAFQDAGDLSEAGTLLASEDATKMLQSPQSDWFKQGAPDTQKIDKEKLEELLDQLKKDNPQIPPP